MPFFFKIKKVIAPPHITTITIKPKIIGNAEDELPPDFEEVIPDVLLITLTVLTSEEDDTDCESIDDVNSCEDVDAAEEAIDEAIDEALTEEVAVDVEVAFILTTPLSCCHLSFKFSSIGFTHAALSAV